MTSWTVRLASTSTGNASKSPTWTLIKVVFHTTITNKENRLRERGDEKFFVEEIGRREKRKGYHILQNSSPSADRSFLIILSFEEFEDSCGAGAAKDGASEAALEDVRFLSLSFSFSFSFSFFSFSLPFFLSLSAIFDR